MPEQNTNKQEPFDAGIAQRKYLKKLLNYFRARAIAISKGEMEYPYPNNLLGEALNQRIEEHHYSKPPQ